MNRFIAAFLLTLASQVSFAQTELDGMSLRGLAVYQQLRTDYYIGGLYLPQPASTPDDAFFMPGPKRMDLRVVTESWSDRRFSQQWNQLILINNSQDIQQAQQDNIIAFATMLKDDLRAGDHITIDLLPEQGTVVKLNGTTLMKTADAEFFNLLLSCWIGARPPSSGFKQDILSIPGGERGAGLMTSFEMAGPTQSRIAETKAWGSGKSAAPAKPKPQSKPADTGPSEADRLAAEKARREAAEAEAEAARQAKLAAERARKEAIAKALAEAEAKAKAAARSKELINEYSSTMVRASYQHVRYPKRALKLNQQGTVLLEVIIDRGGSLLSSKVIQSSGYSSLDEAAVTAVEKTAPFPSIPKEILGNQIEFTLPFTFQISS
ncbi:protein TonB [Litorivivens lipolytica]|uniref:Protein TonB n=1 Tax=Litorivivens lipolytica TaxID=1524264 RepID=A0A7W4W4Z1_9GAMM|nr:TonB family protein [Litorivivens lipolytica]MBB3047400.1 protein TonB [Litorivivens lipolytica]